MGKKYLKDDIWKKSIPGPGQCNDLIKWFRWSS